MIPTVDDLKSSPMVHRFGDVFNPPGLTNFLGCVQVDLDLVGIRSFNVPPFGCSDTVTAGLFVDGRYFPATGSPITFTWYPNRIERTADYRGLHLASTTVLAVGRMAAVVALVVENRSGAERAVELRLDFQGGVTKAVRSWNQPYPPSEPDNLVEVDDRRKALVFRARQSEAVLVQGTVPAPDEVTRQGVRLRRTLAPGERWTVGYVDAVGETVEAAQQTFDAVAADVPGAVRQAHDDWNEELRACFTPGNSRYSGFLPTLHTDDRDVLKLYHTGLLGVIYFKRDNPHSVYGRAYDTLMPRYWQTVTFLWDYFLSAPVHALLDPDVMRKYLETWMHMDVHQHFGTEYLTGAGVGPWYSVNDFAMTSMIREYVRWTGAHGWLGAELPGTGRRVLDYVEQYATGWRQFETASGLADYGGLNNLLECVRTYVHEVASLNAANVFNLRAAADLLDLRGEAVRADALRREAAQLVGKLQQLYVDGKGYWRARYPDGTFREVRHCYDLLTVLNTIPGDLSERQKAEMAAFFRAELQTPAWMHALSCDDEDVLFSVRPDHQWTGAYPAWPPETARGLFRIGEGDLALAWMKGLAQSANQGPFGQAHFAETVVAPEDGGARKAPPEFPYITDWTCSSNGSWVNLVIESLFGVEAGLSGLTARPQFGAFDPRAELHDLSYQGRRYHVTRDGLREAS